MTPLLLDDLAVALAAVRGAKSQAKVSMRTEVLRAEFTGAAEVLDRLKEIEADLRAVGRLTGEVSVERGRRATDRGRRVPTQPSSDRVNVAGHPSMICSGSADLLDL